MLLPEEDRIALLFMKSVSVSADAVKKINSFNSYQIISSKVS